MGNFSACLWCLPVIQPSSPQPSCLQFFFWGAETKVNLSVTFSFNLQHSSRWAIKPPPSGERFWFSISQWGLRPIAYCTFLGSWICVAILSLWIRFKIGSRHKPKDPLLCASEKAIECWSEPKAKSWAVKRSGPSVWSWPSANFVAIECYRSRYFPISSKLELLLLLNWKVKVWYPWPVLTRRILSSFHFLMKKGDRCSTGSSQIRRSPFGRMHLPASLLLEYSSWVGGHLGLRHAHTHAHKIHAHPDMSLWSQFRGGGRLQENSPSSNMQKMYNAWLSRCKDSLKTVTLTGMSNPPKHSTPGAFLEGTCAGYIFCFRRLLGHLEASWDSCWWLAPCRWRPRQCTLALRRCDSPWWRLELLWDFRDECFSWWDEWVDTRSAQMVQMEKW